MANRFPVSFPRSSVSVLVLLLGCAAPAPAPSPRPELYGAGLFSTGAWDFFLAMSPDQHRVLFCRANDEFTTYEIFESRLDAAGHWSPPARPSFATAGSNADPHFSPDGMTVYFISDRPIPGDTEPPSPDIYRARLGADGSWGSAERLPAPINLPGTEEWSPSVAANGDLYFGSNRPGGQGDGDFDLYVARWVNDHYVAPQNLGPSLNTAAQEVEPWIAPDQSYLIFSARGRPDSTGRYDLYLSRRGTAGWQPAVPLTLVNSPAMELNHSVSPDGAWFYFSSNRSYQGPLGDRLDWPLRPEAVTGIGDGRKGDIYRLPMSAILQQVTR